VLRLFIKGEKNLMYRPNLGDSVPKDEKEKTKRKQGRRKIARTGLNYPKPVLVGSPDYSSKRMAIQATVHCPTSFLISCCSCKADIALLSKTRWHCSFHIRIMSYAILNSLNLQFCCLLRDFSSPTKILKPLLMSKER
jgi:hypothetical protein